MDLRLPRNAALLILLGATLAASCPGCGGPKPSPGIEVKVGSVSITPARIHAAPGTSFEMRALPRSEENGYLLPEFLRDPETGNPVSQDDIKVTWSIEGPDPKPLLDALPQNFHRVVVRLPTGYSTSKDSVHYDLVAQVGGKRAESRIIVIVNPGALLGDVVHAPDPNGKRPTLLVVDAGEDSSPLLADATSCPIESLLLAIAGRGLVGDLYPRGCQRLSKFDVDSRVFEQEPVDWGDGVDASITVAPPGASYDVPVASWLVDDGNFPTLPSVPDLISADFALANELFAENRVGLRLIRVFGGDLPDAFVNHVLDIRDSYDLYICAKLQDKMEEFAAATGANAVPAFDRYVIHAFYVAGERPKQVRGEACDDEDGKRAAILIYVGLRLPIVLTHELGHILGLVQPEHFASPEDSLIAKGDTDALNLLAQGPNVLTGVVNDWAGASRSWLSVGQVYWMNRYVKSFMEHARASPYDDGAALLLPPPGAKTSCSGATGHRCPDHDVGVVP